MCGLSVASEQQWQKAQKDPICLYVAWMRNKNDRAWETSFWEGCQTSATCVILLNPIWKTGRRRVSLLHPLNTKPQNEAGARVMRYLISFYASSPLSISTSMSFVVSAARDKISAISASSSFLRTCCTRSSCFLRAKGAETSTLGGGNILFTSGLTPDKCNSDKADPVEDTCLTKAGSRMECERPLNTVLVTEALKCINITWKSPKFHISSETSILPLSKEWQWGRVYLLKADIYENKAKSWSKELGIGSFYSVTRALQMFQWSLVARR